MTWYCYALISDCGRYTYIGKTNDLHRRLRQHNGEIVGGAKYTRKGRPWSHLMYVEGFPTNSLAMCFEWAWKHKRKRGRNGVYNAFERVCNKRKWTKKCPDASTMPLHVHFTEELEIRLPKYVRMEDRQTTQDPSSDTEEDAEEKSGQAVD